MKNSLGMSAVLAVLSIAASAAAWAAPVWTINSLNTIGCNANETNFSTTVSGYTGGPERFHTIVDAGGLRYMDEDAGQPSGGNGSYGWSLYNSSSGGPTTATFPIPPNIPVTVNFQFINGVLGPPVFWRQVILSQCNGGVIVSNVVLLAGVELVVPTLDPMALAAMAGLLALAGAALLRRRRTAGR